MNGERCAARVFDYPNPDTARNWADHQCRYRASTTRAVSKGDGRVPVCWIHRRQRRRDFAEWKP